jgi:organic hydroperoxide reductase OsmC/OhrA
MKMHCCVDLEWSNSDNAGHIVTPAGAVSHLQRYDETSDGQSPESLLVAAVSSCYSITLSGILRAESLPQARVLVHADGVIVNDVGKSHFVRVTVNPTIRGADVLRRDAYERAAITARDECVVGKSIRGNVAYVVGDVSLQRSDE